MIRSVSLQNFKVFERLDLPLRSSGFLAGTNNAGKSTLLAAIRTAAYMIRVAERRAADVLFEDGGVERPAYSFSLDEVRLVGENLRHEFRNDETRLQVNFDGPGRLVAIWPAGAAESEGAFYIVGTDGTLVRRPRDMRDVVPSLGIIPVLAPLEHTEQVLSERYLRTNVDSALASRHLRNQLARLESEEAEADDDDDDETWTSELARFLDFALPWIPEVERLALARRTTDSGIELDLYYSEPGSHVEKEIFWAGDGIQIWLQLLFHLFRLAGEDVILLDEPEVFLHPDIQRRLVRVLEFLPAQTVTATHSPEILAEADPEGIVWLDRRRAVPAPSAARLQDLTDAIGTGFNLRLARALRAKVVLFVEGKDMRLIRDISSTIGAFRLASERGVAVIPLEGFSRWQSVAPFSWLLESLLADSVRAFVVLDRDYRPDAAVAKVERELVDVGVKPHVWRRKELESYLLVPEAISRITGASPDWVDRTIDAALEGMKSSVSARMLDEELRHQGGGRDHLVTITERFQDQFEQDWGSREWKVHRCPPKQLMRRLNDGLQAESRETISARKLAAALAHDEVTDEMTALLTEVDAAAE